MADFRRSIIVLAALALLLGMANAAFAQTPLTFLCTANAGVPPLVRSEGETELVGDNVLNCLNGTSTGLGKPVPTANIQIFLNTALTSRLIDTANNFSEALLMVDEPAGTAADPQVVCTAPPCSIPNGLGAVANPAGNIYKNNVASPPNFHYNVWVGKQVAPNSVVFLGVPIDPPGTQNSTSARIFRFTNVRANASGVAVASGGVSLPSQVQMVVSSSGTTSLPINNPTQVVGIVVAGLIAGQDDPIAFPQCNSENVASGKPDVLCGTPSGPGTGFGDAGNVSITEGFATASKLRVNPAVLIPPGQDTPGFIYNSESGLFASGNANSNIPPLAGVADFATRYAVTFANVPAGVSIFVPLIVSNACTTAALTAPAGNACFKDPALASAFTLKLVTSDRVPDGPIGSGIQALLLVSDAGLADECVTGQLGAVAITGGAGAAIYEVVATNPTSIDSVSIPVTISYVANPGAGSPGLGAATASVSFAPIIADATAEGSGVAVPRFVNLSKVANRFTISACETNILWPFVTTLNGYDTGLVIANTSVDPFGTSAQTGICTFNPYNSGTLPTLPAFPTPAAIKAGDTYANLASVMFPGGFQGYVIAVCEFQYAHGYGFLQGAAGTPETVVQGYIALIIPNPARVAQPLEGPGSGEQLGM